MSDKYRVYLTIYRGPYVRMLGVGGSFDPVTGRTDVLTEVAYPPLATVVTIDSPPGFLVGEITSFADASYGESKDVELRLQVGFGHTPYHADYRSKAAIQIDSARSD